MLQRIQGLAAALALMAGVACTGEFVFTFTLDAGYSYGADGSTTAVAGRTDAFSATEKQMEINVSINLASLDAVTVGDCTVQADGVAWKCGADFTINSLELTQMWSLNTQQQNTSDGLNAIIAAGFGKTLVYQPSFVTMRTGNMLDVRYIITLQYGWNSLKIDGTVEACGTDSKGNVDCESVVVDEAVKYIYGDFGGMIPMKVTLTWNGDGGSVGSDLDLYILENSAAYTGGYQWVHYGYKGYGTDGCMDYTDRIGCIQNEFYTIGKNRTANISFGSLDKDEAMRGGPESYSLDAATIFTTALAVNPDLPTAATPGYRWDGTNGDVFEVFVNYFQDNSAGRGAVGQKTIGVVSIYLNGSSTPDACIQTPQLSMDQPVGNPTQNDSVSANSYGDAAWTAGKLVRIGDLAVTGYQGDGITPIFNWLSDSSSGVTDTTATTGAIVGGFCKQVN